MTQLILKYSAIHPGNSNQYWNIAIADVEERHAVPFTKSEQFRDVKPDIKAQISGIASLITSHVRLIALSWYSLIAHLIREVTI